MTPEDRLRDALDRHTATVTADRPEWAGIEARAEAVRAARRRRRFTVVTALTTAAALVAVLLAVVAADDDSQQLDVAGPGSSTTLAVVDTAPSTTQVPPPPDPAAYGGIYPDARAYQEDGVGAYADPEVTARAFAIDYLGMQTPVVGAFSGGEVAVRPNARATLTTTLTLVQVGEHGPWTVQAASADDIEVTGPVRGATISSPVQVRGRARAFEGHVDVVVRESGMRAGDALGKGFVTGASDQMGPFDGSVTFRAPRETNGAVLFLEPSAEDGSTMAATVVRVRFPQPPGSPTTVPPPRLSSSVLSFDGYGPVRIGMTAAEAEAAAGAPLGSQTFGACTSLEPEADPPGLAFVLTDGQRITVITVTSGPVTTDKDIRIGSSEGDVLSRYDDAEVRDAAEPRHWVFARSGEHTMIFEIENGAVVAFRTGLREVVEQDEICA